MPGDAPMSFVGWFSDDRQTVTQCAYSTSQQDPVLVFRSEIPGHPWYPRCQSDLETHWCIHDIAHPQIICIIVVLKVLKLASILE